MAAKLCRGAEKGADSTGKRVCIEGGMVMSFGINIRSISQTWRMCGTKEMKGDVDNNLSASNGFGVAWARIQNAIFFE